MIKPVSFFAGLSWFLAVGAGFGVKAGEAAAAPEAVRVEAPAPGPEARAKVAPVEVVVSASRLPAEAEKTGVSVEAIRAATMAAAQQRSVGELLQYVPGVVIAQAGPEGSQTHLFLRGGNSNHAQILYDGWKMNRQGGSFDFAGLEALGLDRIEVARGPISALSGSDALTGAVNLVTARGEGRPELTVSGAGGTRGTDREGLSLQGREKQFSYNLSASRFGRHDGPGLNSDLDAYNYALRLDYDFSPDHALKLVGRGLDFAKGWYEDSATGYGPAVEPQDPNDRIHSRDWLAGLEYSGQIFPNWQTQIRLGHYGIAQRYDSTPPNPSSPWLFAPFDTAPAGKTVAEERRYMADWQNNVRLCSSAHVRDILTLGASLEQESFYQRDTIYNADFDVEHLNWAVYAQNRLELYERAFLTLGLRREENEEYGSFLTLRGDLALRVPETGTQFHASAGNSFRSPSFYELYAAGMGNPNLDPETNFAWDAGLEQAFRQGQISLRATYFENAFEQLISYDYLSGAFGNDQTASSRGVELGLKTRPVREVELQAAVTWLETEDAEGREQLRRPEQTYTGRLILRPLLRLVPEKFSGLELALSGCHVGERTDIGPTREDLFARVRNPAWTRLDLAVSYRFLDCLRARCRIENLTRERYENVRTFPAEGVSVLGGLEFSRRF